MAPFRGRGGMRGRGRGGVRSGRGRGGRGGARGGRRNDFVAARVQDPVANDKEEYRAPSVSNSEEDSETDENIEGGSEEEDEIPAANAYRSLLMSFGASAKNSNTTQGEPRRKRRKLDHGPVHAEDEQAVQAPRNEDGYLEADDHVKGGIEDLNNGKAFEESFEDHELDEADHVSVKIVEESDGDQEDDLDTHLDLGDAWASHIERPDDNDLKMRIKAIVANRWTTEKLESQDGYRGLLQVPGTKEGTLLRRRIKSIRDLKLKPRLVENAEEALGEFDTLEQAIAPSLFDYQDVLFGARTVKNAGRIRDMCCLHALNHILKTRDRILKNNEKLSHMSEDDDAEYRDQGFTRPKILFLLETKQACVRVLDSITKLHTFEQQENKKRFLDSFSAPEHFFSDDKPDDFRELFEGNDENEFRVGVKLTRKTMKYYSKFYASDIIFASTLGLRRAIEGDEKKKKDYDFLSSIEMVIMEQADATLMQNWDHTEFVFSHLNLQPKDAHDCDFSRVRPWYLDGHAPHVRQTIVLAAYLAPKINTLYNKHMLNFSGRLKITPSYDKGVIEALPYGIKQTFSRFDSPSYLTDPDARFKYFSTTVLPRILKTPKPLEGGIGVLLFIPSYLDFVRVRNALVDTDISYASISEYTDATDVRRARSHFLTGRHSLLLYTGRAHHFHRYHLRGVKRVVFYGVPENPRFYEEVVGFVGKSVERGEVSRSEARVQVAFSKWERLELERVVGAKRVGRMVKDKGDVFDFV
ncbi:U3 small nucleolar RNA-associated protein 25 [Bimuria novae-zelandiae CBS 107.79]|uniref:U3 small nucleolar RNA-associated protein 25 n=1 Tax=Bimuria novae-zelandiae CBS 107.79 TaxID=1447943 RepID=A0A6A5URP2_9PLEO|nr:U3 small nucleolar RNA-associated protein 25 [Bimuria novae-zelandiae CBS 107.79]